MSEFNYNLSEKYIVEDGKIMLKDNLESFIYDDDIDSLPFSFKLYAKLKKLKFFNNISNLINSDETTLTFYGLNEDEIKEIYKVVNNFLENRLYKMNEEDDSYNELTEEEILKNLKETQNSTVSEEKDEESSETTQISDKPKYDSYNEIAEFLQCKLKNLDLNKSVDCLDISVSFIGLFLNFNITTLNDLMNKLSCVLSSPGIGKTKIKELFYSLIKVSSKMFDDCGSQNDYSAEYNQIFDYEFIKLLKNNFFLYDVDYFKIALDNLQIDLNNKIAYNDLSLKLCNIFKNYSVYTIDDLCNSYDLIFNDKRVTKIIRKEIINLLLPNPSNINNNIEDKLNQQDIKENLTPSEKCENELIETLNSAKFDGLDYDELVLKFTEIYGEDITKSAIDKLISDGKAFIYDENKIFYNYPTFAQFIYSLPKGKIKDILYSRLDGVVLEEIGQKYQVTRERIRQIFEKQFKKIIFDKERNQERIFKEDRFKYIFTTYEFDRKSFIEIFNVKERTFNYLKMRYKNGSKSLNDALNDDKIYIKYKLSIKKYLEKDYAHVGEKLLVKSNTELAKYFISKFCIKETHVDEIYDNYVLFIQKYVPDFVEKILPIRSFYNMLDTLDNIISISGKKFRYYDYDSYDFSELIDTINLAQYDGMEISTELFMREYPVLMETYDIHNKYELHNILKRINPIIPNITVDFSRQPTIKIGHIDRKQYLINILKNNGKLRPTEIAKIVEEETGIDNRQIVCDNWIGLISEYQHNGLYSYDNDYLAFTDEEFEYLKENLVDDFYPLVELKKLLSKKFNNFDFESKFERSNFDKLGYNLYSNFILIKPYTAVEYIESKILNGILSYDSIKKILPYSSFNCKVSLLQSSLDLIRFSQNGDFISIKKLEANGITKNDLYAYAESALSFVEDDEFFTIHSLRDKGFSSPLDDLGFDDIFYESILKFSLKLNYNNIGHVAYFNKTMECFIGNLIADIVNDYEKIEYYDLIDLLKDKYGIDIEDKYKITYSIKNTDVYYDNIMEIFYKNYLIYYKEI